MEEIVLPYGRKTLRFKRPANLLDIVCPRQGVAIEIAAAVNKILENPIGLPPLEQLIKPGDKVAVVIPDKTRRNPSGEILPFLLDRLEKLRAGEISLIIANAAHNRHPLEELGLGENILKRVKLYNHDARRNEGMVKIGVMPMLFPWGMKKEVWVNKAVARADLVIVIGSIIPHLMAGFSGGAKGIIPGVAGLKTIGLNHFFMLHPHSRLGVIEGNILRGDLEKGAGFLKNVFIINAVYDSRKEVVGLVGGDMVAAHREGVKLCREIGEVKIKKADIVISADTYPETINIYQAIKLIAPAAKAVNPGGVIICAGECPEGEGELTLFNRLFYNILIKEILPRGVSIYFLSEANQAKNFPFFLKPIKSIEEGIELGLKKRGPQASILILSGAGLLIPIA